MNKKLISLLLIVCAVLVLIIVGEWLYAKKAQRDLLASTSSPAKKVAPDAMPTLALTKQPEESYDQLVNRPLFVKGRKPVEEPKPETAQVPVVVVVFDWELNGIYTKNKSLSALFSRAKTKVPKDNYRKIAVGADLDGWKLTEIKTDRAIFMQGANKKEVLLRKAKPKSPLPQNRPAPPVPQAIPIPIPNPENIPVPESSIPEPESEEGSFENNIDEQ